MLNGVTGYAAGSLRMQEAPRRGYEPRTLAFYTVILKIEEWQNIWLTRLAVWGRVKIGVKN
jgi:hypothetical protein